MYNEDEKTLQKTIDSFLQTPLKKKLFLVDNSATDKLKKLAGHNDIEYIFNGKNVGFAKANNVVLERIKNLSNYHLILNPDVVFSSEVIPNLITKSTSEKDVALITPKVEFTDGSHQYSVRKYPKPLDLIFRRLNLNKSRVLDGEYRNQDLSKAFNPECISGCFMLFKTEDFTAIKGFDERYFLYLEDFDICKKVDVLGKKKLYFPQEKITHVAQFGSAKKLRLLIYHISSAIKYFNKWGWR